MAWEILALKFPKGYSVASALAPVLKAPGPFSFWGLKIMGRRSLLTPKQWEEVERRALLGAEPVRTLAREYGIEEAAIRHRINNHKSACGKPERPIKARAAQKV